MKRVYLPLLILVVLAFATTASACEKCVSWGGQTTCWSGYAKGAQSCYGGWGAECVAEGQCPSEPPFEGGSAPLMPADRVCADGVLGCRDAAPAGFALDKPSDVQRPAVNKAS